MSVHTDQTFWPALRRIIPNLPEHHVTKCLIVVEPGQHVKALLTVLAVDEAGNPKIDGEGDDARLITETRRFRIVPDEDPT